jgi:hypothetical protein
MLNNEATSLIYLIVASLLSVLLAYIFGNEGYEALITTAIALGFLITWQLLVLARLLFRTKAWLIIKIIGLLPIGFIWFIAVASVISSISSGIYNPAISPPSVNWFVVCIGTLPFLIPRLLGYKIKVGSKKILIGSITSIYSLMVLYIAVIGFYDNESKYRSLILVLAVQLQYIMSYTVTRTNYLNRSHDFAVNLLKRLRISSNDDAGQNIIIFIVGLPFILPLAVVLLVSSLH